VKSSYFFLVIIVLTIGCNMKIVAPSKNMLAPSISLVSDQNTLVDTSIYSLAFTISDDDSELSCSSSVVASSSNSSVITTSGLQVSGSAPNCLLDLTPVTSATGVSTIALTVRDGRFSTSTSFVFEVFPGNAAPVASSITPAAFNEDTQSIITLVYSDADLDLAATCSISGLTNVTVTQACACSAGTCTVGVTGTTNYNGAASFSYTVTAAAQISNSALASLTITAVNDPPVISDVAHQTTNEDTATSALAFTITDVESTLNCATSMSGSSSNTTLLPNASIVFGGTAPNCTVTFTPALNQNGTSTVTLTVTDGSLSVQDQLTLTVTAIDDAPTISAIADQATTSSTAINTIAFTISDVDDTVVCASDVTGSSSYTSLVANASIVITGAAQTCNVQITPTVFSGTATITLTVSKNMLSNSETFDVVVTGIGWYQEAYIKSANSNSNDWFGSSVSLNGDTLVVGTFFEDSNQTTITNGSTASSDNSSSASGAAYVYKRAGSIWSQEAYIKSANAEAGDYFAAGVSLSGDTLAIGALYEDSNQTSITNGTTANSDNSNSNSGAVYVYKRTGTSWSQEAYIKAANNGSSDELGWFLSLSGSSLVVAAYKEDSNLTTITNGTTASSNNSNADSGAVYVYSRTGVNWAQEAYIKASNNNTNDNFGYSVSLSGDTLAVGSLLEDSNQTTITNGTSSSSDNSNSATGAVYVYKRSGVNWAQEAYIKPSNSNASDIFGYVLSLSGDRLAVGAPGESSNQTTITNGATASADNSNFSSGAAYIFKRSGVTWEQEAYIKAVNNEANDSFGAKISLSGNTLVVGSINEDSNQTTITNGTTASSNNSNTSSGAVYVYKRTGVNWAQEAYIKAVNNDASDEFATAMSVSGDTLAVSAPKESSNQTTITNGTTASSNNSSAESGAVYIYRNNFRQFDPADATITTKSETTLTLAWQTAGFKAAGYFVAYQIGTTPPADCNSGTVADLSSSTLLYTISSLQPATTYSFRICSYDESGTASEGVTSSFSTLSYTPEITNLAASHVSLGLNLSWTAAGGSTASYQVAYQTGSTAPATCSLGTSVNVGNVTSYNFQSLIAGQTYSFRVCSVDASSHYSFGETVSGTTTSGWYQEAYIKADNNASSDEFGKVIELSGNTLVVGVPYEDSNQTTITNGTTASSNNSNGDSGAVYVYKRSGTNWAQEAYIKAANNNASDLYATSVSLSGDTIAVGAIFEDSNQTTITNGTSASSNNSNSASGAVYIYKRTTTSWAQEAYIKAANNNTDDFFGGEVSLSGDTLIVGSRLEDSNQTTITNGTSASSDNTSADSGASYIYRRSGTSWAQEAYLKAVNNNASDVFGVSVTMSLDTAVVSAHYEDSNVTTITNGTTASSNNSNSASGAVYIYKRNGTTWSQEAYIKAANNNVDDNFGRSLSLSGDTLAVGVPSEDSNQTTITNGTTASTDNSNLESGAVYVFKRGGATWTQQAYIKAVNGEAGDQFGQSVSVSGDTLVVGANFEDSNQTSITNGTTASSNNSTADSGAAYVFRRVGTTWSQEAYIKSANSNASDYFGVDVSLSGDTIAISAPSEDSNQTTISNSTSASSNNSNSASGAVYIFRNYSRLFDPPDISFSQSGGNITFSWGTAGSLAAGYVISYQLGSTAPATCSLSDDLGNVMTTTINSLLSTSTYSFRLCSYDGSNNLSEGVSFTIEIQ
jgi:hypothetical protein